jgi:transposase InsO family protein
MIPLRFAEGLNEAVCRRHGSSLTGLGSVVGQFGNGTGNNSEVHLNQETLRRRVGTTSCCDAAVASHSAACGASICRMFSQIIAGKSLPRHLSSDHDPLFRFHRWLANLRILEVEEIKSIPYVPVSHPFVERLIGTIRREFLDHVLIWNTVDLGRKLEEFRNYYNENRVHQSLSGSTPGERSGQPPPAHAVLDHYAWRYHCRGLFQMPIAA